MPLIAVASVVMPQKMFFIHPMWFDEGQRVGKQKCTPIGYAIHGIAEMIGFVGLLLLFATPVYLAYTGIAGTFNASLLWLLERISGWCTG
jgi:hypothetical protein